MSKVQRSPPSTPLWTPVKSLSSDIFAENFNVGKVGTTKRTRLDISDEIAPNSNFEQDGNIEGIKVALNAAIKGIDDLMAEVRLLREDNSQIKQELLQIKEQNKTLMKKAELRTSNEMQEECMKQTKRKEEEGNKRKGYAEVVKEMKPALLVKGVKDGETAKEIMMEIKKKVSPKTAKIRGTKETNKGNIIIECENHEAVKELKEKVEKSMGPKVNVEIVEKRKPKVKVMGMEDDFTKEEIQEYLMEMNGDIFTSREQFNIVHIFSTPRMKGFKMELESEVFELVMKRKSLMVGWFPCRVQECLDVLRCYKCQEFGHKSTNCTKETICAKCGGEHVFQVCQAEKEQCINCMNVNKAAKLSLDVNHTAWSNTCSVLRRKEDLERRKIGYKKE